MYTCKPAQTFPAAAHAGRIREERRSATFDWTFPISDHQPGRPEIASGGTLGHQEVPRRPKYNGGTGAISLYKQLDAFRVGFCSASRERITWALHRGRIRGQKTNILNLYGLRRSARASDPAVLQTKANQARGKGHDGRVVLHGEGQDVRGCREKPAYGAHWPGCLRGRTRAEGMPSDGLHRPPDAGICLRWA